MSQHAIDGIIIAIGVTFIYTLIIKAADKYMDNLIKESDDSDCENSVQD